MSSAAHTPDYTRSTSHRGRSPTRRGDRTNHLSSSSTSVTASPTIVIRETIPATVYVVTDTCYPTQLDFNLGAGTTRVDSVHSTEDTANAKARKVIFQNGRGCKVDIDKIIEENKNGLYTGIGVGGNEHVGGCCYARKCEVERMVVDHDSEDD